MTGRNIHHYVDLTSRDLQDMDRDRTVVFSSLSPVETHGDHPPLGTDLFIAESVRDALIGRLLETHPDFHALVLPTLPMGANAIPVSGSLDIGHKAVYLTLRDTGRALAAQGFRTWVITDNHGGPLHQVAVERVSREMSRRKLVVIAPFHALFRRMVRRDPDLLAKTGLSAHKCGAPDDAHAGTNETSLMLALHPGKIGEVWKTTGPARTAPDRLPFRLLHGVSRLLAAAGYRDAATDFHFLSQALAWVNDSDMASYQGDPSIASVQAGQAMFDYHVNLGTELLERALSGRHAGLKPIGWTLRFLRHVM